MSIRELLGQVKKTALEDIDSGIPIRAIGAGTVAREEPEQLTDLSSFHSHCRMHRGKRTG